MDAPTTKDLRITGAARAELRGQLKTAYESGTSIRSFAEGLQRSYGSTRLLLVEAGTVLRNRGGQPRKQG